MAPQWKRQQDCRAAASLKSGGASEYDDHIVNILLPPLNSLSSRDLANGDDAADADPLDNLDPALDTLPYLYTLHAQLQITLQKATKGIPPTLLPGGGLFERLSVFLRSFDPIEVRYAGHQWRFAMEVLADIAQQDRSGRAPMLVDQLLAALFRLDPSAATFTSLHLRILQICLQHRLYTQACLLLDKDIYSFPSQNAPADEPHPCSKHQMSSGYMTIRSGLCGRVAVGDVLEFHLLGAMALIALTRWTDAMKFLEYVLSAPTQNAPSGIMLEAYKKWVFVSLLVKGKPSPIPPTTNSATAKLLKSAAKAYDVVGEAFAGGDRLRLDAELQEAAQLWHEDGNSGLASQVAKRRGDLLVLDLQKQYASIPLSFVAAKIEMPHDQTQQYLQALIDAGTLDARLDKSTDASQVFILRFSDKSSGASNKSELRQRDELVAQTKRLRELSEHIGELDRKLSLSKEYLDHTRKVRKNKDQRDQSVPGDGEFEHANPVGFGAQSDDDENVMDVG